MLTWGITLIVVGIVLAVLSFVFAAVNMGLEATGKSSFGGMVTRHLGAMIVIALAGLTATIGVIITAIHFLQVYLRAAFE
jgi:hypothetical protein